MLLLSGKCRGVIMLSYLTFLKWVINDHLCYVLIVWMIESGKCYLVLLQFPLPKINQPLAPTIVVVVRMSHFDPRWHWLSFKLIS